MKFSTRELVILAVFGVLWGIVEMSLGTVLKSLNVPFSGAVLGGIGLTIALIGRVFVPRRGSTLFLGIIAMLLKLFSLGGVVIGPMIGILGESLVAEVVLSLGGQPRRVLFLLAGALGVAWSAVQPFITGPLIFGVSLLETWGNTIDQGSRALGIDSSAVFIIAALLIVIRVVPGIVAGWFAWDVGRGLQKRLGRSSRPVPEESRVPGLAATAAVLIVVVIVGAFMAFGTTAPADDATATPADMSAASADDTGGTSLIVTDGETHYALSTADLQALAVTEAELDGADYQGATLSAILEAVGVNLAGMTGIKAVASDGYASSYDAETVNRADVIVAYTRDGGPLADNEVPFRMVVPGAENSMQARMVVELQVQR
jgi:hypothetical protein